MLKRLMQSLLKRKLLTTISVVGLLVISGFLINIWVLRSTNQFIYYDINQVVSNDVGLVLGTSSRGPTGGVNRHFKYRIEAAAALYKAQKVKHLIVSGDNHIKEYDEPTNMKEALMKLGVPESAITLDYAGFRTLDSVVRAKEIFSQQRYTVITDDFHAPRAVFLSRYYGIETVAFCSKNVPFGATAKTRFREYGARIKACMDLYILNVQPKFLGEKVEIKIASNEVPSDEKSDTEKDGKSPAEIK